MENETSLVMSTSRSKHYLTKAHDIMDHEIPSAAPDSLNVLKEKIPQRLKDKLTEVRFFFFFLLVIYVPDSMSAFLLAVVFDESHLVQSRLGQLCSS